MPSSRNCLQLSLSDVQGMTRRSTACQRQLLVWTHLVTGIEVGSWAAFVVFVTWSYDNPSLVATLEICVRELTGRVPVISSPRAWIRKSNQGSRHGNGSEHGTGSLSCEPGYWGDDLSCNCPEKFELSSCTHGSVQLAASHKRSYACAKRAKRSKMFHCNAGSSLSNSSDGLVTNLLLK